MTHHRRIRPRVFAIHAKETIGKNDSSEALVKPGRWGRRVVLGVTLRLQMGGDTTHEGEIKEDRGQGAGDRDRGQGTGTGDRGQGTGEGVGPSVGGGAVDESMGILIGV